MVCAGTCGSEGSSANNRSTVCVPTFLLSIRCGSCCKELSLNGTLPVEVGKCVTVDVITSSVCGENVLVGVYGRWCDKAVDVITWSTDTAGGRVSADIITSRGSIDVTISSPCGGRVGIDVTRSSACGGNADAPDGAHGRSGRGNVSGAADG